MPAKGGEVQELISHVRKAKFKVVKSGNQKHYKVLDSKGRAVVDEHGPLIISSSPGDFRWREMHVKRLMGAGVLKTDPWKETRGRKDEEKSNADKDTKPKRKGNSNIASPEVQAAKVAAIHAKSERNRERTAVIRGRFEPIVSKLGGWSQGGRGTDRPGLTAVEVGQVVFHWAQSRGRMELPKRVHSDPARLINAEHVSSVIQRLKKPGETLSEKWTPLIEVFIDELQRNAGMPPDPQKAAYRYRELLRESKGIDEVGPQSPAALPPVEPLRVAEVAVNGSGNGASEERVKLGPAYSQRAAPKLALRAMWFMAKGSDDLVDALDVASEIAELELNKA